jgi:hypothetical protein
MDAGDFDEVCSEDGPIVIDVPLGLQGIIDDCWQWPIESVDEIESRKWMGDSSRRSGDAQTEIGPATFLTFRPTLFS